MMCVCVCVCIFSSFFQENLWRQVISAMISGLLKSFVLRIWNCDSLAHLLYFVWQCSVFWVHNSVDLLEVKIKIIVHNLSCLSGIGAKSFLAVEWQSVPVGWMTSCFVGWFHLGPFGSIEEQTQAWEGGKPHTHSTRWLFVYWSP